MKVGDRIMIQPQTFGPDAAISKVTGSRKVRPAYPGTITYIHPRRGWYQVTFDNGVKECFFAAVEPTQIERVPVNRSRLYGSVINDN